MYNELMIALECDIPEGTEMTMEQCLQSIQNKWMEKENQLTAEKSDLQSQLETLSNEKTGLNNAIQQIKLVHENEITTLKNYYVEKLTEPVKIQLKSEGAMKTGDRALHPNVHSYGRKVR